MVTKVQTSPYKSLPDSEQITTPAKVSRLLRRFTKHYTPLTVQIPGHKGHYSSCIVAVDEEYVLLDELLPTTGHQLLVTEGTLLITGNINGVDVQFFTTLEHVSDKKNILTYYIKLPKLVEYRQRRQNYRIRIPMTLRLSVNIKSNSDKTIIGELHDLSNGGAGMIFLANENIMKTGEQHECAIELPDGEKIYCTVKLRYSKEIPSRNRHFIGVQFIGLSPAQSQVVSRCINELERELIKKRSAY